jgi:hypothetical protein
MSGNLLAVSPGENGPPAGLPQASAYLAGGVELDSPGFFELPAFFFAASASAAFLAAASCFLRIISASLQNRISRAVKQ